MVNDEPLNLIMLFNEGYRIQLIGNGKEALPKAAELPDLSLMDIMLPELNRLETCRFLKVDESYRDIPVIFLSAFQ